jgi:hypothetical protein
VLKMTATAKAVVITIVLKRPKESESQPAENRPSAEPLKNGLELS